MGHFGALYLVEPCQKIGLVNARTGGVSPVGAERSAGTRSEHVRRRVLVIVVALFPLLLLLLYLTTTTRRTPSRLRGIERLNLLRGGNEVLLSSSYFYFFL